MLNLQMAVLVVSSQDKVAVANSAVAAVSGVPIRNAAMLGVGATLSTSGQITVAADVPAMDAAILARLLPALKPDSFAVKAAGRSASTPAATVTVAGAQASMAVQFNLPACGGSSKLVIIALQPANPALCAKRPPSSPVPTPNPTPSNAIELPMSDEGAELTPTELAEIEKLPNVQNVTVLIKVCTGARSHDSQRPITAAV